MKQIDPRTRSGIVAGLAVIGLIACLPILFATAFVLRFALMALAVLVVVGAPVLYALSPAFRQRVETVLESEVWYKGLRQATDVALSPFHVWARVEPDEAVVGADDVAQSALGPVTRVDFPAEGSHVSRGEPLFALQRGGRRLELPSPIDGTVLGANDALREDPGAVNREPFGCGWVVRLQPDEPRRSRRSLLRGLAARAWFQGEVDRLVASIGGPQEVRSLPDGGVVVDDLYRLIDESTWERLRSGFFTAEHRVVEGSDRDLP